MFLRPQFIWLFKTKKLRLLPEEVNLLECVFYFPKYSWPEFLGQLNILSLKNTVLNKSISYQDFNNKIKKIKKNKKQTNKKKLGNEYFPGLEKEFLEDREV